MQITQWGQVTPEFTIDGKNEYIYVYNHDLSNTEKVERTIRFIVGRLNYYDCHLPLNPKHFIQIDIRGQQLSEDVCDLIISSLESIYSRPNFMKVSFIKK